MLVCVRYCTLFRLNGCLARLLCCLRYWGALGGAGGSGLFPLLALHLRCAGFSSLLGFPASTWSASMRSPGVNCSWHIWQCVAVARTHAAFFLYMGLYKAFLRSSLAGSLSCLCCFALS